MTSEQLKSRVATDGLWARGAQGVRGLSRLHFPSAAAFTVGDSPHCSNLLPQASAHRPFAGRLCADDVRAVPDSIEECGVQFGSRLETRSLAPDAARNPPPVTDFPDGRVLSGQRSEATAPGCAGSPAVLALSLIHISEPTRPY